MKRITQVTIVLAVCMAMPGWAAGSNIAKVPSDELVPPPPAVTADLPQPPRPPGLPVPQLAPAKAMVPVLTVDLTKPLTVEQALCVAFERNPDLRIAVDIARRSVGVVEEAKANFNPKFNGTITSIRQPSTSATFPGAPGKPDQSIVIQSAQSTTAAVVATLPLDISHRLAYTTDVARYQFDIQYLSLVAASERVIQNVKATYYEVLRAYGQQGVAQAAVDVAKAQLDNTKARFEAGAAPKFDVTTAEVNLANLNQQLIQAQTRTENARSLFNRALGIGIDTPTQVINVTPTIDVKTVDISANIATAEARRPEVRAGRSAIALNQRNVKLQQTGLKPSLSWNVNMGFNANATTFSNQNVNWQTSLVVSAPIWDGGITKARVAQARADVANAADTLDLTKLQVGLDVRTAALNVEEAAKRSESTTEAVALAEEALRLANVRYEAGIAVLVEVTNAESQLTQAQFNLVNAQYDYAIALAALQRATSTQPELNQVQLLEIERMHS